MAAFNWRWILSPVSVVKSTMYKVWGDFSVVFYTFFEIYCKYNIEILTYQVSLGWDIELCFFLHYAPLIKK